MTISIIFCIECAAECVDVVGWIDAQTAEIKCHNCGHESTITGFTLGRCISHDAKEALKEALEDRASLAPRYKHQKGRFELLVLEVVELARQRRRELRRQGDPAQFHNALIDVIEALSPEERRKMAALMHSGRDERPVMDAYERLEAEYRTWSSILQSMPVDKHLIAGLAQARIDRIDLEASFERSW